MAKLNLPARLLRSFHSALRTVPALLIFVLLSHSSHAAPNQWTCFNGSPQPRDAFYGALGESAPANWPGVRSSASARTGTDGNLWLFGGNSYGIMNDLWKYNTETGYWTWMKGSSSPNAPGIYGTKGEGNPANSPGARDAASTWVDSSGILWLFGGSVGSPGSSFNDLWKYEPLTDNWTWKHGSDQKNQPGNYGIRDIATTETCPGARYRAASWADSKGDLWMFGGRTTSGSQQVALNDFWRYNPTSNRWTWVGGSNTFNSRGTYGVQGVQAPDNIPGARDGSVSWTDSQGNLWLFGGSGFGATSGGFLNDLWKFTPSTGLWT